MDFEFYLKEYLKHDKRKKFGKFCRVPNCNSTEFCITKSIKTNASTCYHVQCQKCDSWQCDLKKKPLEKTGINIDSIKTILDNTEYRQCSVYGCGIYPGEWHHALHQAEARKAGINPEKYPKFWYCIPHHHVETQIQLKNYEAAKKWDEKGDLNIKEWSNKK